MKSKVFGMDSVTITINQSGIRLWVGTTELPYDDIELSYNNNHLIIKTKNPVEREEIRRNLAGLTFIELGLKAQT